MNEKSSLSAQELAELAVRGLQEKKGVDIVVLDMREFPKAVADFLVICSGTSDTHVDALGNSAEGVIYKLSQESPWHTEGKENRQWVLLDYVNVVVHIFQREKRDFYALEELWGDAPRREIPNE